MSMNSKKFPRHYATQVNLLSVYWIIECIINRKQISFIFQNRLNLYDYTPSEQNVALRMSLMNAWGNASGNASDFLMLK